VDSSCSERFGEMLMRSSHTQRSGRSTLGGFQRDAGGSRTHLSLLCRQPLGGLAPVSGKCPCQELNLIYDLRRVACSLSHSRDMSISVPRRGVEPRPTASKAAMHPPNPRGNFFIYRGPAFLLPHRSAAGPCWFELRRFAGLRTAPRCHKASPKGAGTRRTVRPADAESAPGRSPGSSVRPAGTQRGMAVVLKVQQSIR
jgi:hypothetical protein